MQERFRPSLKKAGRAFLAMLPIVVGMLLLTSLVMSLFSGQITESLFGQGVVWDTVLGALIGSVALGHPSAS
jgi:ABC-type molybdate transport system permease subunit